MKKFLETGNNDSLITLLMLSDDSLEALCYCETEIIRLSTRGREGNILSEYNYIFENTRELYQYSG